MCGIAGLVGAGASVGPVAKMVGAMHHRGPDDQGTWSSEGGDAVLGNCRLSIIDLSATGHMPMSDASGKVHITYNGEIYNLPELRTSLRDYPFRGHSDTEAVLAAYLRWGENCLAHLTGMFAFAIVDTREPDDPRLMLARDRMGIKPLYFVHLSAGLAFASEIKVLLASGLVEAVADRQSVWDYLSLGSVPGPRTMIQGVSSLPPAHVLVAQHGTVTIKRYWSLPSPSETSPITRADAAARVRALLEEVIAEHMVADVPVGTFLSGGIDSTSIAALAARHSGGPLQTFTVRFGDSAAAADEAYHAAVMAKHLGASHTEVSVTGEDVADALDEIILDMDQPSIDGVNTWFVSQAASRSVKVALSGLGADETFAGYPHFRRFSRANRIAPHGSRALATVSRLLKARAPGRITNGVRFLSSPPLERHLQLREVFDPDAKQSMAPSFRETPTAQRIAQMLEADSDVVNAACRVELQGYLVNTLLRDADAMSMSHSVEVRVPFVDHRVVETALSLPGSVKVTPGGNKTVLKEALADLLPEEILHRPKSYFSMPLQEWAAGPLLPKIAEYLASDRLTDLFGPEPLAPYRARAGSGSGSRGWALAVLSGWLDAHGVQR